MPLPWSLQFVGKYRRHLTLPSLLRLRSVLVAERRGGVGYDDTVDLTLKSPFSASIRLRPRSNDIYTFDEVFMRNLQEPAIAAMPRISTIIDLGANIGLSTIYFLGKLPGCRILAFEPDRANFELLTHNTAAFRDRVVVEQAAAWTCDGPVRFMAPESPGHVNAGAVAANSAGGIEVPGYSLASIIERSGFDRVGLLKIDIEGAEEHLFEGDCPWLSRVDGLSVEFHHGARERSGFDRVMTAYGFAVAGDSVAAIAVRGK